MSGPLRRLARRASAGKLHRVRPMVRLPFSTAPELLMDVPEATSIPPSLDSATWAAGKRPDRQAHVPYRRPFPQPTAKSTVAKPTEPTSSVSTAPDSGSSRQLPSTPRDASRHAGPSEALSAQAADSHWLAMPPSVAQFQAGETTTSSLSATDAQLPSEQTNATPPPIAPFDDLPAPLVEERGTPSQRDGSMTTAPTGAGSVTSREQAHARPPESGDADEIHIHIGRIEVTAVQEPGTPPRRRKPKGREPMSLDDYLARRRQPK